MGGGIAAARVDPAGQAAGGPARRTVRVTGTRGQAAGGLGALAALLPRGKDYIGGDKEGVVLHGRHHNVRHVPNAVIKAPPAGVAHTVQLCLTVVGVDASCNNRTNSFPSYTFT